MSSPTVNSDADADAKGRHTVRRIVLRRRWMMTLVLAGLIAAVLADHGGWLLARNVDDLAMYHGQRVVVDRVIDGDTVDVRIADALQNHSLTRVCVWGINCPEVGRMGKASEPVADQATELARSLIEGRQVLLRLETHRQRDSLGRVLAHVELPDGRTLGEELLAAGLARADDRWPHTMLVRYGQVEFAAKRKAIGLWKK